MKPIKFQKDILPHLLAVIAFLSITILFFSPTYFDGKVLSQGDIAQWEASAQELIEYREATGEEGLWTNSIFGGMPAYLISVKWGNGLIKAAHAIYTLGLPHPTRLVFGAMLSFYIMLLCFKVRPYVAIMGALAFGLSSYNIIGLTAGHNARIAAVSFMPLVMGGIHLAFGKHKWLGAGLTALALAMEIRVNHLQITYYLAFIVGLYGLMRLIEFAKKSELKLFTQRLGLLILAAILAVGSTFGELYTTYEYGKYSNRGKSELTQQSNQEMNEDGLSATYAFQYSNGMWDPFTLFIPNALGGGSFPEGGKVKEFLSQQNIPKNQQDLVLASNGIRTYWGKESPTTYYTGAIMIFLMVLGLLLIDKKYTIWLIGISLLGILFSYGRNLPGFNYFMFDHFPGYNKFRSVTFTMVMPIFAISFLGCLALEKLLDQKFTKEIQKKLLIALASTAGFALLLGLGAGMFSFRSDFDVRLQQELLDLVLADRRSLFRGDAFRAFGLISAFAAILYVLLKNMVKPSIAIALLILVAAIDVIPVSNRFIGGGNYTVPNRASLRPATPADQFILQNKQLGDRVIDSSTPSFYDGRASQYHHLVNGYHGARIRRYQELIDNKLIAEFQQASNGDLANTPLLNMLNTKFIIENPAEASGVKINERALGSAWFVDDLILASNPDEEFQRTLALADPGNTAVVPSSELNNPQANSIGQISLVDYHPGYWKYQSNNSGDGFAVFSEIYYPKGFKVTIDGNPAEMTKANYVLRGLEIPAGEHIIEFSFAPKIYAIGSPIMLIMSILVLLGFVGGAYMSLKRV